MVPNATDSRIVALEKQVLGLSRRLDQLIQHATPVAIGLVVSGSAPSDTATGQEFDYSEIVVQLFEPKSRDEKVYQSTSAQVTVDCLAEGNFEAGTLVILHQSIHGHWVIQNATCDPRISGYTPPASAP